MVFFALLAALREIILTMRKSGTAQDMAHSGEFVGEALVPVAGTANTLAMGRGEPGLPGQFVWRGQQYRIVRLIQQWKSSGPCRSGSSEIYLRRHWYRILTDPPMTMTIYCDRQAKNRKRPKARWWVYTINSESGADF